MTMTTTEAPVGLIDVTSLTLSDLWTLDRDDVLSASIRRVTEDSDGCDGSVSAFNSAL